jgi:hypothetical protein
MKGLDQGLRDRLNLLPGTGRFHLVVELHPQTANAFYEEMKINWMFYS